ncbi:MAG: phospholipid methyltransferase [Pseudomonadota bacterium]
MTNTRDKADDGAPRRFNLDVLVRRKREGSRTRKLLARLIDEARFLRNWADNPLRVGAVAPSSPELCRLMAGFVEADRPGLVVELGPGTGAVTQAMLDRGVAPERLVLIEYSADFCALLRERFPGVTVVNGNAYALGEVMDGLGNPPIASVISGLPLVARPVPERQALLSDAMARMAPGAPFIQFSYMLVAPVKGVVGTTISSTRWVLANLPPARVWLYRADEAPMPA